MNKKRQIIKSTDWLIKGYSEEEIARMKAKAINEANEELYNKEIEEMANDIWTSCPTPDMNIREATYTAEKLYNAGYRKRIEAKWIEHLHFNFEGGYSGSHYECSNCHCDDCYEEMSYCPYCGAKMKGGK